MFCLLLMNQRLSLRALCNSWSMKMFSLNEIDCRTSYEMVKARAYEALKHGSCNAHGPLCGTIVVHLRKNMSSKQILHTTQRIRCNGSLFSFVCTILLSMWKNKHTAHTNCTLTLTLNFSIVFHRRIATCDYCQRTSCAVASYTIFSCYLDHFCNPLLLPSDFFLLVAVFIA